MLPQKDKIYLFDEFQLNFGEKTLRRGDVIVSVTPKVFETLHLFLRRPGFLIEKEEMMRELWGDRIVEESNLTFNIKMLRKALGDDAQNPRFVETLPKRGYRFIADVRYDQENGSNGGQFLAPDLLQLPAANSEPRPEKTTYAVAHVRTEAKNVRTYLVIAALMIASAGLGYYFFTASKTKTGAGSKRSIAVLPVIPINSTNRDEDYEIGIADSLIDRINSMEGLLARPLNSTRKYSDIDQDPIAAGREQNVDYVLASTYQSVAGKVRINSKLIDTLSGVTEETLTIEKDGRDFFEIQDAVVSEISDRLMYRFATTVIGRSIKRGTNNADAYRLYLQGMTLYDRRTLADAEKALDKLDRATRLDPDYAKAWAGKAHVHRSLGYFSINRSTHDEYANSIDAINRALSLDENLSDAHSALCENKFFYEYDFEGAERSCKRAIELEPNSFIAHEIYSRCLWTLNRFDDAIKEVELSIDLHPTSLFTQRNYGISLFYARKVSPAIEQFQRVSEVDPTFVANYAWFVPALLSAGRKDEAFDWFIKWQTQLAVNKSVLQAYEKAYREEGWKGIGRIRVAHLDESKVRSYFLEACLSAHTGNHDQTFEYLERSLHRREWGIPFLRIDPNLDGIRSDPRFEDLAARVKPRQS